LDNSGVKLTLLFTEAVEKMPYFKRDYYEQAFTKYCVACDDVYKEISSDLENLSDDEKNNYLDKLADEFVSIFANEYSQITKKGKQTSYITEHNAPMVIYVFPGILNFDADWSVPFCDVLKEKWNKVFNIVPLSYGTYGDIKSGFKTKLCYITTAVCNSLNMSENCKELTMLKDYRDNILLKEKGGEAIVNDYYDIAPTIVKRINKSDNCNEIYKTLYTDHISKCIEDIENKQFDACKEQYMKMINELKSLYIK